MVPAWAAVASAQIPIVFLKLFFGKSFDYVAGAEQPSVSA